MRSATIRWSSSWPRAWRWASCSALQGVLHLTRYGAAESLGPGGGAVAGARTRPGGDRPAVCRPRRDVADCGDRADEGRRATRGNGDDGGRSAQPRAGAAVRGRHRRHAAAGGIVLGGRDHRRLHRRRATHRHRCRRVLVADAVGRGCLADVGNGIVKSFVFGVAITYVALYQGYESRPRRKAWRVRPRGRWSSRRLPCSGSTSSSRR